jgi:hypothetical protein
MPINAGLKPLLMGKAQMLKILAALAVILAPGVALAQDDFNVLKGTIAAFECGDNCYLTVDFGKAGELVGLCVAPECESWNANVAIPKKLIGAKVTVAVGTGDQYQGGDTPVPAIAFTTVTVKSKS